MRFIITIAALMAAALLGGCAGMPPSVTGQYQSSATYYTPQQAQQVSQVNLGTVINVRSVQIAASQGAQSSGGAIGALAGYALGRQIGGGQGRVAAEVIGALAGAAVGNTAGNRVYSQPGLMLTVKLDNGQILSITQAADIPLQVGQRIELVTGGWGQPARVIPAA